MTGNQPANVGASACFVVERVRCEGYQVTSAEGPCADKWKGRALDLLDILGQPDPKGPAEDYRLVGPITPSGEYVGVSVKLTPNGEARYHQAWFQTAKPMTRPTRFIGLLVCPMLGFLIFFAGFFVGALAGPKLVPPGVATTPGFNSANDGLPGISKGDFSAKDVLPDMRLTKLDELKESQDVRVELKKYLAQEEFAADISKSVVEVRRSVRLISDLDKTRPSQESLFLNNLEVAKLRRLLGLLETLDDLTNNPKPAQKFDGR